MKDAVGIPFEVGQVVTYPGRFSSSLYIRRAVVREVLEESLKVEALEVRFNWQHGEMGYVVHSWLATLTMPERVTITRQSEDELMRLMAAEADEENSKWRKRRGQSTQTPRDAA